MKGLSVSGTLTDTANYDAFGVVTSRRGTSGTQKGFAGMYGYQEDDESGYKLLGHRYYDPEIGRFLSRDPIRDGRNWYTYCGNNPVTWIDPEGLGMLSSVDSGEGLAVYEGVSPGVSQAIAARHASMIPEWVKNLLNFAESVLGGEVAGEEASDAESDNQEPTHLKKGKEKHRERLTPLKARESEDLDV